MPLQTAGSLGVHAIVRANRVEQRYGHSNDPNDCSHFHGKLVDSIFTDYSDTLAGLDGQRDITHRRGQHSVTLERDGEAINLEQGGRHDAAMTRLHGKSRCVAGGFADSGRDFAQCGGRRVAMRG